MAHLHMGSWKTSSFRRRKISKLAKKRAIAWMHPPSDAEKGKMLYPVSLPSKPPFTVMTHLTGQGDCQVSYCRHLSAKREWAD